MHRRDLIALAVLATTAVVGVLVWQPVGRWASLIVLLAGMFVAAGVYRARPSAIPLRDDPDLEDPLSTPRRASAPHGPSSPGSRNRS